jgi:hypothetical protein
MPNALSLVDLSLTGSCDVAQAGLKLLNSWAQSDPLSSASHVARITGMHHCTQLTFALQETRQSYQASLEEVSG